MGCLSVMLFCHTGPLVVAMHYLYGFVEIKRWVDFNKPGSQVRRYFNESNDVLNVKFIFVLIISAGLLN